MNHVQYLQMMFLYENEQSIEGQKTDSTACRNKLQKMLEIHEKQHVEIAHQGRHLALDRYFLPNHDFY